MAKFIAAHLHVENGNDPTTMPTVLPSNRPFGRPSVYPTLDNVISHIAKVVVVQNPDEARQERTAEDIMMEQEKMKAAFEKSMTRTNKLIAEVKSSLDSNPSPSPTSVLNTLAPNAGWVAPPTATTPNGGEESKKSNYDAERYDYDKTSSRSKIMRNSNYSEHQVENYFKEYGSIVNSAYPSPVPVSLAPNAGQISPPTATSPNNRAVVGNHSTAKVVTFAVNKRYVKDRDGDISGHNNAHFPTSSSTITPEDLKNKDGIDFHACKFTFVQHSGDIVGMNIEYDFTFTSLMPFSLSIHLKLSSLFHTASSTL